MKKKIFNTEKIIGFSAMFISLLTLIIFLYQTRVISKQARLSVTPRISFNSSVATADSTIVFSIGIKNNGLGPAIIDSSAIFANNKYYPLDFKSYTEKNYPKVDSLASHTSSYFLTKGATLLPNNEIVLTEAGIPKRDIPAFYKLYNLKEGDTDFPFDIIIYYSSIYEEKWKVSLKAMGNPIEL
ncbi:hypothetical protein U6A24_03335 [Aquimarina gracilis]|uniref:Uncharacterized protein n=1 Tax=Aquimarina gracilis TaxID=874422 RepID=A0ABU5ZT85_9FLAO|nr:hypothetical protein [Aquimarina gracilis]MEB3344476.1 hypothetical protein [Aquimarina gracilis]